MIHYELINATNQAIDEFAIRVGIQRATVKLPDIGERTIVIEAVKPNESQHLNFELRGEDHATDCISISTDESDVGKQIIKIKADGSIDINIDQKKPVANKWPVIGQLVICPDVIKTNAAIAGQPVSSELEWVIEHGILHVMGFHHEDTEED